MFFKQNSILCVIDVIVRKVKADTLYFTWLSSRPTPSCLLTYCSWRRSM